MAWQQQLWCWHTVAAPDHGLRMLQDVKRTAWFWVSVELPGVRHANLTRRRHVQPIKNPWLPSTTIPVCAHCVGLATLKRPASFDTQPSQQHNLSQAVEGRKKNARQCCPCMLHHRVYTLARAQCRHAHRPRRSTYRQQRSPRAVAQDALSTLKHVPTTHTRR